MADQTRRTPDSSDPENPDREVIRDDTEEEEDETFDDADDLDEEEENEEDLGKNVRDQERGMSARRFTDELGSDGDSSGRADVQREDRRRVHAGEATTTGGEPVNQDRRDR